MRSPTCDSRASTQPITDYASTIKATAVPRASRPGVRSAAAETSSIYDDNMTVHTYSATLSWSGTTGNGYRAYERTHTVSLTPRAPLTLSADAVFRGDESLPNPEQLLVAAASSCQLLSFLSVAARAGVDVIEYTDQSHGKMPDDASPVSVTEIELRPVIRVRGADAARVTELVAEAHGHCYIANSLRSEVRVIPKIDVVP